MLLLAVALAQDPAVVDGHVVLTEQQFRGYVALEVARTKCEAKVTEGLDVADALYARLMACYAVGTEALDESDAARQDHLELVADLGRRLERAERRGRVAGVVGVAVGVGLTLGAAWGWGQVAAR